MRKVLCMLCISLAFFSCSKENIPAPQPQAEPLLKRTVVKNSVGVINRISHYNEFELVTFDTIYQPGTAAIGMTYTYTYNSKGKQTFLENSIPILYTGGPYWAYRDEYKNDTVPTVSYRYLKGKQTSAITHFYNTIGQLVLDSTYHTPNYGTFTYLKKYEYDGSGRLSSTLDLNDSRDTTEYITYQYTLNRVESFRVSISYGSVNTYRYGKEVKDYTPFGKILSEKMYDGQTLQLYFDYTYDAGGRLLKKATLQNDSNSLEELYFNNILTGKLEKIEYYSNGQMTNVKTYYYE
jgi:hypothetical protein